MRSNGFNHASDQSVEGTHLDRSPSPTSLGHVQFAVSRKHASKSATSASPGRARLVKSTRKTAHVRTDHRSLSRRGA